MRILAGPRLGIRAEKNRLLVQIFALLRRFGGSFAAKRRKTGCATVSCSVQQYQATAFSLMADLSRVAGKLDWASLALGNLLPVRKTEKIRTRLAFFPHKAIRPRLQTGPYTKPLLPCAFTQAVKTRSCSIATRRHSQTQTLRAIGASKNQPRRGRVPTCRTVRVR